MLKIETETRRFILKEGSEALFDQIIKKILGGARKWKSLKMS